MKRILTAALVLALCLSLAVPAFAAAPETYQNADVTITGVIDKGDLDTDYSGLTHVGYITRHCTCVAPVTITPAAKFGAPVWFIAIYPENPPEDGDVSDLDWDTYAGYTGASLTLTEPGDYSVGWDSDVTDETGNFILHVESAVDLNPPKPETTDPTTTTPVFSDVKNTDWFAEPVKWAVEQKITTGTTATTFSPTQDCSVAQILTFLWRAAGSPEAKAIDGIDENLYYAGAVAWAVEKGMISAEDFTATAPCTRSMAVQFIWQAAGSPKADAASFTDVPADAEYANAVAWAVKEGVTTGTSETTFAPDTVCNRGHIVTFLYRAFAE